MTTGQKYDIVFVITTTSEDQGGISAVNRMLIPTLVAIAEERDLRIALLSMQGTDADRPTELASQHFYRGFEGRRALFAAALLRWSRHRPVFLFERVGLARTLLPLALGRMARMVIFAHGSENWKAVRLMESLSISLSELIITNSLFTLRKMEARFGGLRAVACPLGLSASFPLRATPPVPSAGTLVYEACDGRRHELGDRVLLLVGRLHPAERMKGHDRLIRVLPQVLARHPNAQLMFCGPGTDREWIVDLAREANVASSVFIPGFVHGQVLEELYARCFAFIMPSTQEGFGLVYLEAMNSAKACVGCIGDGAQEVIRDGETGYLLRDAQSSEELVNVLFKLLDDPQRTVSLGLNGFERLHQRFTVQHFRSRFKRILTHVLDGR